MASRAVANASPIVPGRKPNWLMWTEDAAVADVGQDRREEAAPVDVDLRRGGAALVEREREIGEADRRAQQALRAPADVVHDMGLRGGNQGNLATRGARRIIMFG